MEYRTWHIAHLLSHIATLKSMFPSVGHHRVMEAARGALVTMVLKW